MWGAMTCNPLIIRQYGDNEVEYWCWCRGCGWESDVTASEQVARMRVKKHKGDSDDSVE